MTCSTSRFRRVLSTLRAAASPAALARPLLTATLAALLLPAPAHAYLVALNSGTEAATKDLLATWKWRETAEKMDVEMFIGPWASPNLSRTQRSTIMNASRTGTTICESEYAVNGLPVGWVNDRKIPTVSRATFYAGGSVQWVMLYNAGVKDGVPQLANLSAGQLSNAKAIFDEQGKPASIRRWATIIRSWNSDSAQQLSPFQGLLFELRINDYNGNARKRADLHSAIRWGLDNRKTVFVQLIAPDGSNPQYIDQWKAATQKLRAELGSGALSNDRLVFVCASYDSSSGNVGSVPERVNGWANQASTSGAALALINNRASVVNGRNGW